MALGDAFSKLETFVRILNRISRSITWSLFTLKASYTKHDHTQNMTQLNANIQYAKSNISYTARKVVAPVKIAVIHAKVAL